jgi:hypothetical protein
VQGMKTGQASSACPVHIHSLQNNDGMLVMSNPSF